MCMEKNVFFNAWINSSSIRYQTLVNYVYLKSGWIELFWIFKVGWAMMNVPKERENFPAFWDEVS